MAGVSENLTAAQRPTLVLCQSWLGPLGGMGGLPALAGSGADKLPLAPVNPELTEHQGREPHFTLTFAAPKPFSLPNR
jgi:hypothetical protein